MSKTLVIVESPTKAKTITRFLDGKYKVEATYVIPPKSKKRVAELKKLAKDAPEVILATDEDREGEAIAWHLLSALGLEKKTIKRIAFHEITKTAIAEALEDRK